MSEVRLWNTSYGGYTDKEPEPCGCDADPDHGPHHQDGTRIREYIALPAAKHAALMRVVAWAESVVGAGEGTPLALCALMNHRKGDYHGALDACPVVERVRADLAATAPGRQGEAPR